MYLLNTGKYIAISLISLLAIGFTVYGAWNYFTVPDRTEEYLSLRSKLEASKSNYAKCYNSVNYGTSALDREFKYGMKYIKADGSDDDLELFKKAQNEFMSSVNEKCNPIVDDYEKAFSLAEDIYAAQASRDSWEDYLFSVFPGRTLPDVQEYDPSLVRFNDGFALSNFVFTEQDLEQMYVDAFGY